LRAIVLEVEAEWYERELLLLYFFPEGIDLAPVEEKLPHPFKIILADQALVVAHDIGTDEPELAVTNIAVRPTQTNPTLSKRLHLGTGEVAPRGPNQSAPVVRRHPRRRALARRRQHHKLRQELDRPAQPRTN